MKDPYRMQTAQFVSQKIPNADILHVIISTILFREVTLSQRLEKYAGAKTVRSLSIPRIS